MILPAHIDIKKLRTWDVILHHDIMSRLNPSTWPYWIIRKLTNSNYNHSSEIIILDGEIYLIESLRKWVTLTKYYDWLEKCKNTQKVTVLRYRKQSKFNDERYKIKWLRELDKHYDRVWLLKDMALYVLFGYRKERDEEKSKRAWRCSEFNAYMKDLNGRQKFRPGDFTNHEDFIEIN